MSFTPSLIFIAAMIAAESGGQDYKIRSDRHGGLHYGCLQISEAVITDVNEFQRSRGARRGIRLKLYRHRDMLRREPSIEVFKVYLERYCTRAQLGHEPTEFDAALIWRYGPTGRRKNEHSFKADAYWRLVESHMDPQLVAAP